MKEIEVNYQELLHLTEALRKKVSGKIDQELAVNGNSPLYFQLCKIEQNAICSILHLRNIGEQTALGKV